MILNPFRRRKPTPSEAARVLSELACLGPRERIRERARLMCAELGKPIPQALQTKD